MDPLRYWKPAQTPLAGVFHFEKNRSVWGSLGRPAIVSEWDARDGGGHAAHLAHLRTENPAPLSLTGGARVTIVT